MTNVQVAALEKLKERFLGFYGYAEEKEFKQIKTTDMTDGSVYVFLEVGYIGDEGTMQAIVCRNRLSVCIGKKGGYFNYSDSKSHYRKTYSDATLVCCRAQW